MNDSEHLSFDEAAARYEATEDFLNEAIDTLNGTEDLPVVLRVALLDWYRSTAAYERSVEYVIEEAAKP